jgi:deferrochelatase/peroxidase EfeB
VVIAEFDLADLQGNIVRGYRRAWVRYLMLEVDDPAPAKRFLGAAAAGTGGAPAITTASEWPEGVKPASCFNIALTWRGLAALGLPDATLSSFPTEFIKGMTARAVKLGDVGDSDPSRWDKPFDQPDRIHVIATIHADDRDHLDQVQSQVQAFESGAAFTLLGAVEGNAYDGANVHFGYKDGISQPRFDRIHDSERTPDRQPLAPLGSLLLGFRTVYEGVEWRVPQPDTLGLYGSFNAFRVLEQDVAGFEAYLDSAATILLDGPHVDELLPPEILKTWNGKPSRHAAMRELIAAKMCGRWRNGTPVRLSPHTPDPVSSSGEKISETAFDYDAREELEQDDGLRCPHGAHIRRCNPRGGAIVQRVANNTRRLVRRGTPYGPVYNPDIPDTEKRGLLGNFMCANLGAQFEAVMCDWVNLGLQDPHVTGSNDPLLGVNDVESSWFDIPLKDGKVVRLEALPRFVNTRGGAYLFQPSIPALRHMAAAGG